MRGLPENISMSLADGYFPFLPDFEEVCEHFKQTLLKNDYFVKYAMNIATRNYVLCAHTHNYIVCVCFVCIVLMILFY